ncbi:MAG: glycosyltransferase [Fibrobacterota bacterium]|nr:glycosyltransferase [Fibrobacterota bacterium]
MKIAVLSSFPPRKCGIAYLTKNLFDELRLQGHQLVTFGIDDSECDHLLDTASLTGLLKILPILKRDKIDHVSIQFIVPFYNKKRFGLNFLLLLWALRKKRVIVTLHELHYLRSLGQVFRNPLDLFHIVLEGLIARMCTGVILHTETQADILRKYGVRNARCIRLGIQTLPIPRERKVLNRALFFGKLAPIKGVHLFAGIAKACPEIHFTIATSVEPKFKPYLAEVERLLTGIPNLEFLCKEWIGDEEKEGYFAAADVLVLPYVSGHYQSGAASESGVYNIPAIVTDLGPLTEVPKTYGSGVVVSTPSPEEIKAAIGAIFGNYGAYLEGVRKYRNDANWATAAAKYAAYLKG